MVPLRGVLETLNSEVHWDQKTKLVTIKKAKYIHFFK
ncbi:hypothetical protein KHA80_12710 [Anaerobacillus sp. HL2]|nr:hypothetical protein KHA80_12710 [Anaerobacillus sp. HL2]